MQFVSVEHALYTDGTNVYREVTPTVYFSLIPQNYMYGANIGEHVIIPTRRHHTQEVKENGHGV